VTRSRAAHAVRLAAAAAILLAGGWAVARSSDPPAESTGAPAGTDLSPHDHRTHHHGSQAHDVVGDGRSRSVAGYSLDDVRLTGDRASFRVLGPSGQPETRFATTHTKRLHMFVFGTDLTDFRHVHRTAQRAPSCSARP
jgi:hypothetical protein